MGLKTVERFFALKGAGSDPIFQGPVLGIFSQCWVLALLHTYPGFVSLMHKRTKSRL